MVNYMLKINQSVVGGYFNYYITMVDFEDKEDAERILSADVFEKIRKFINLPPVFKSHMCMSIVTVEEVRETLADPDWIKRDELIGTVFIVNGSDEKVRLVRRMSNLNFNPIMPLKVIRISVFEKRDDTVFLEYKNDILSPYIDYKKISGDLTYIREFENSASLVDLITAIRELNMTVGGDEVLGFLVEYRDARIYTIKFVESVMNRFNEPHCSISVDNDTIANKSIDYLMTFKGAPLITPLDKPSLDETIVLLED